MKREKKGLPGEGGVIGAPLPDPPLQGLRDGTPRRADRGRLGGRGSEVPQHIRLKMIPRCADHFEVCIIGDFLFEKKNLPSRFVAQVVRHH